MRKVIGRIIGWFLMAAYPLAIKRFNFISKEIDLVRRKRDKFGRFAK